MSADPTTLSDRQAPGFSGETFFRYWRALRPQFLLASLLPVVLGTAWGAATAGRFDPLAAAFFLVGMMLGHGAGNVINDVCDDISGNDRLNEGRIHPFTGGSRMIQDNLLSRRAMARFAVGLLAACAATGLYLVTVHGPDVLIFGLAMGAATLAYHLPPLKLNHRGLAETIVGITFGVAPVCMAAWLQSGVVDAQGFLLSLPVSFWIANVLLINEVPDRKADAATHKHTLVVLLGTRPALWLHGLINLAALAVIAGLALRLGALPLWSLAVPGALTLLTVPAVLAVDPDDRSGLTRAIKATLTLHAGGTLSLALAAALG